MTTREFLAAVKKAGLRFVIKRNRTIRTRCGMCPIEALAHAKRLMPVQALYAAKVWWAAHRLGLTEKSTLAIVTAADYSYRMRIPKHRPAAKRIRKYLLTLSERER